MTFNEVIIDPIVILFSYYVYPEEPMTSKPLSHAPCPVNSPVRKLEQIQSHIPTSCKNTSTIFRFGTQVENSSTFPSKGTSTVVSDEKSKEDSIDLNDDSTSLFKGESQPLPDLGDSQRYVLSSKC